MDVFAFPLVGFIVTGFPTRRLGTVASLQALGSRRVGQEQWWARFGDSPIE